MIHIPRHVKVTCLALLALACAPKATPPAPEPEVIESEQRQARPDRDRMGPLGVPEGELPPLGECRVWLPGQPVAQQTYDYAGKASKMLTPEPVGITRSSRKPAKASKPRYSSSVRIVDSQRSTKPTSLWPNAWVPPYSIAYSNMLRHAS